MENILANKYKRENNFDLLRLIATIAVILLHTGNFFDRYYDSNFGEFCSVVFRIAVPLFLMLSGAFILKKKKDTLQFYKKALLKLGKPLLLVSIISLIYSYIKFIVLGNGIYISLKKIVIMLLIGEPFYHLWYMYMLIGLYLLVPVLQYIKERLTEKQFIYFSCFAMLWGYLSLWTIKFSLHWNGECLSYIGYFLLGYILKNNIKEKKSAFFFVIGIIILIINYCLFLISSAYFTEETLHLLFTHRLSPLISLGAFFIFIGFSNLKIKVSFFYIAEKTYLIYLIHGLWLAFITVIIRQTEAWNICPIWIFVLIVTCITFILSYISSILYEKYFSKFVNNIHL